MNDPSWLTIEDHEDPEAIGGREVFGDFVVSYSDIAARDHSGLVRESIAVIAVFPGVTKAIHEDREQIVVWGQDVDRTALRARLTDWWTQNLESN